MVSEKRVDVEGKSVSSLMVIWPRKPFYDVGESGS